MQSEIFHLLQGHFLTTLTIFWPFLNTYLARVNICEGIPLPLLSGIICIQWTFPGPPTSSCYVVYERLLCIRILVDGLRYRFTEFILVLKSSVWCQSILVIYLDFLPLNWRDYGDFSKMEGNFSLVHKFFNNKHKSSEMINTAVQLALMILFWGARAYIRGGTLQITSCFLLHFFFWVH